MDTYGIEWVFELFEEIEGPTQIERAMAYSLLLAEVENWRKANPSS